MTEISDNLGELNEQQRTAVTITEGPLRIVAGAGAGKTRTLTARISHLIKNGVHPARILAITFTNKAAGEMQERTAGLLAEHTAQAQPFVSTFHALGVHILRESGEVIDIPRFFSIVDQKKGRRMIKQAIKDEGLDPKEWKPKKIQGAISNKKGAGVTFNSFAQGQPERPFDEILLKVWRRYENALADEGGLDFDDLLLKPRNLLKEHEGVRERYQHRWHYIHIDEYQDTNRIQYQLARLIAAPQDNICVVGDADQTIYSWRGAEIENILNFEKDFPQAQTVMLEQNYRSTQTILAAAHDIISKNDKRDEKKLYTRNPEGEKLEIEVGYTAADEAGRIARRAGELINEGVDPNEIAVLYRTNFQSRVLEDAFLKRSIPYHILGTRFFDRREVRDVLSYLRLGMNPESQSDFNRIINRPRRGIGKKTQERIVNDRLDELSARRREKVKRFRESIETIGDAIEERPASKAVTTALEESGMKAALADGDDEDQERWENVQELVSFATKYDEMDPPAGIEKLLENAALIGDQDTLDEGAGGVRLMTVHAAKGLEFDHVFISGLEQGLFPQERESASRAEQEEERRLMYVALTRARKRAYLSYAQTRTIFGSRETQLPSEFLDDISEELIARDEDVVDEDEPIELLDI